MSKINYTTKYAPAERSKEDEINRQNSVFQDNEILNKFLEKIPAVFIIVNKYRQIVYMNKGALEFTGLDDVSTAVGKRPGELIGCIHSNEEEWGCGTSESCTYCGAVNAVLESQKGKSVVKDCRLILGEENHSVDLRIWASPLKIDKEEFTAITLQDIQHEKWRFFLERIFFHDILNTATGLQGTIDLLIKHKDKIETEKLMMRLDNISHQLIEEIRSQQLLIFAENDLLELSLSSFNTKEMLEDVINMYDKHELTEGKILKIDPDSDNITIKSDRILIRRILGNMTKNALEAISKDDEVTLGCNHLGEKINFWVHNSGFISRDIQLQIFNRSFSTKGNGRGLGTYSMKLLSKFLEGNVSFETSQEKGTTFNAEFPINFKERS